MKNKMFNAIGLMSGTSMDGVDASIIKSDGYSEYISILDEYYEFDENLHKRLVNFRNCIFNHEDLVKYSEDLKKLEREITFFHSEVVNKISLKFKDNIDLVGFHGQTIFHNPKKKISKQIGDGNLLSQLIKKRVVYDFRQQDLINGGQGAPLTPIFHNLLSNIVNKNNKLEFPISILNIGGIANITLTFKEKLSDKNKFKAFDIGPGNCLIDDWIRKNSNYRFDNDGLIAKSGKTDHFILNQAIENFRIESYDESLDIKDFDLSFAKGMSLENGSATLTKFTAYLVAKGIEYVSDLNKESLTKYLICGGGRKNKYLIENIKKNLINHKNILLEPIDKYNLNGDYIESQAFAYLSVRSLLKLPISFPETTRCKSPTTGGKIVENF